MSTHSDNIILVRQDNQYRRGRPVEGASAENWESQCGQLFIDEITVDDSQTITVEAVDEGDDSPNFKYRLDQGSWTDTKQFTGVESGKHYVFVKNENTGCVVNQAVDI